MVQHSPVMAKGFLTGSLDFFHYYSHYSFSRRILDSEVSMNRKLVLYVCGLAVALGLIIGISLYYFIK